MRFIKLNRQNNDGIFFVNTKHVASISRAGDGARIAMSNGEVFYSSESPDVVLSKVEVIG